MSKFHAQIITGNGYTCSCCRQEQRNSIDEDSREAFIKEFYSDWKYSGGDISLSYLKGITQEEISELISLFEKMGKVIDGKEKLNNNLRSANLYLESVSEKTKSSMEVVSNYPEDLAKINLEIKGLIDVIGQDSLPEYLLRRLNDYV